MIPNNAAEVNIEQGTITQGAKNRGLCLTESQLQRTEMTKQMNTFSILEYDTDDTPEEQQVTIGTDDEKGLVQLYNEYEDMEFDEDWTDDVGPFYMDEHGKECDENMIPIYGVEKNSVDIQKEGPGEQFEDPKEYELQKSLTLLNQ